MIAFSVIAQLKRVLLSVKVQSLRDLYFLQYQPKRGGKVFYSIFDTVPEMYSSKVCVLRWAVMQPIQPTELNKYSIQQRGNACLWTKVDCILQWRINHYVLVSVQKNLKMFCVHLYGQFKENDNSLTLFLPLFVYPTLLLVWNQATEGPPGPTGPGSSGRARGSHADPPYVG